MQGPRQQMLACAGRSLDYGHAQVRRRKAYLRKQPLHHRTAAGHLAQMVSCLPGCRKLERLAGAI